MKSLLKTIDFQSKALGRKLQIRELSAAAQIELTEAHRSGVDAITKAAITCKHGVTEWRKETPDAIAGNVSFAALVEMSEAVIDLSGGADRGHSEADQKEESCSASVSH